MSDRLSNYKRLFEKFLLREISGEEFQVEYLDRFKAEGPLEEERYELLDELFGDVDSFTKDPELLKGRPDFYIDEDELRRKVQAVVTRLSETLSKSR